jgi:elongation factor P
VISPSDFRKGTKFLYKNEPYIVIDFQHNKQANRRAVVQAKIRNMLTGNTHQETFSPDEKFPSPDLEYKKMQYLYKSDEGYCFMDQDNFEQLFLSDDQVEEIKDFLKEQEIYNLVYFQNRPIDATPPLFLDLQVIETVPGVKGDTAQGAGTKPATLETGLVLQVPLFISEGDIIKVDTRDSKYIERIKK